MESTNLFSDDELTNKLEKVFQLFARAQEDWVVARDKESAGGDKKTPTFRSKDA